MLGFEAERLRAEAWAELGLAPRDLARFALQEMKLHANCTGRFQRARDVLDVGERARVMQAIAAAYARLHARAPDRFLWAGFAAIAVNDGVRPTVDLALAAAELAPAWQRVARIRRTIEDAIKCAFEANVAIYADLAWIHRAYAEGGLALVRALRDGGELDGELAAGFEAITDGRVAHGNLALFRREQDAIVTPIFERYAAAMAFATRVGLIAVPGRTLAARCAAGGRSPRWRERASYGPFAARWRWLVAHAWQPYVELDPAALAPAIDRARRGIPERTPAARAALAVATLLWNM